MTDHQQVDLVASALAAMVELPPSGSDCVPTQVVRETPPINCQMKCDSTYRLVESKFKWFKVIRVQYSIHYKDGKPPSLCVEYICEGIRILQFVCFEHSRRAFRYASAWWSFRSSLACPQTAREALQMIDADPGFPHPTRIRAYKRTPLEEEWQRVIDGPITA